ncbi:hypothetical protein Hamer_G004544, partial [Homarus americanus]
TRVHQPHVLYCGSLCTSLTCSGRLCACVSVFRGPACKSLLTDRCQQAKCLSCHHLGCPDNSGARKAGKWKCNKETIEGRARRRRREERQMDEKGKLKKTLKEKGKRRAKGEERDREEEANPPSGFIIHVTFGGDTLHYYSQGINNTQYDLDNAFINVKFVKIKMASELTQATSAAVSTTVTTAKEAATITNNSHGIWPPPSPQQPRYSRHHHHNSHGIVATITTTATQCVLSKANEDTPQSVSRGLEFGRLSSSRVLEVEPHDHHLRLLGCFKKLVLTIIPESSTVQPRMMTEAAVIRKETRRQTEDIYDEVERQRRSQINNPLKRQ